MEEFAWDLFFIKVFIFGMGLIIYVLFVALFVWLLDGWIPSQWLIVTALIGGVIAMFSFGIAAIVAVAVIGALVAAVGAFTN